MAQTPDVAQRRPYGLCLYGVLYAAGFAGRGTPLANPHPIDADGLLDLANEFRLNAVELAPGFISATLDRGRLRDYRARADELGIAIVVAGPQPLEIDSFRDHIDICGDLGSPVLRCTMSSVLEGDRARVGGLDGWRDQTRRVIEALRTLLPDLEAAGVTVAIEDHQDADSRTLLEICEAIDSPCVGVTLDTGNPLAVGEDPVAFARTLLPRIADVHLKDYRMIRTPGGYRLTHCAIGDGVVDFAALWRLLADRPAARRTIEMAAWNERHIRLLTDEWWAGFEARELATFLPVLRLRDARGEADAEAGAPGDWRTPVELGDVSDAAAWERARLERSVANLDRIVREAEEA